MEFLSKKHEIHARVREKMRCQNFENIFFYVCMSIMTRRFNPIYPKKKNFFFENLLQIEPLTASKGL